MDVSNYYVEFITIAVAHLIAVASPGPDFAIVMRHSIRYDKKTALLTSLGVGSAIFVHVAYALAGIGLIISSTPWLYDLLIIVASSFLLYLGQGAVRSPAPSYESIDSVVHNTATSNTAAKPKKDAISAAKAFGIGFMTNGLNPKATLFFLSLFTVAISADTPMLVKAGYGVYLAVATTLWFCGLSLVLTSKQVRSLFEQYGYVIDRVMGWVLIILALHILYSEVLTQYF